MKKINKKETVKVAEKNIEKVVSKKSIKKSKKVAIHSIAFLILLALVGGCFYKFGIAATVNGKPIYRWSYIKELQKSDKKSVLNQMIQEKLIKEEAKNKKVVVDQKEIDAALTEIEEQVKAQGVTLDEALKSEGMTKDELINKISDQKMAEKMASTNIEATQEQIEAFLKENKNSLPTGKTKEELQTLAKEQLETQAENTALNTWYNNLAKSAKIIYK
ncbi:MAG: SurA N-terminal domain-containing protein [Candidatus Shapirobacteria bacterium]|nr:SurA N-terminal domain-containing protein [Candidatus Shapirobacteria bacterium]MDD4410616.1 SurA N-terminal domain-containing protein [Candidatus Shapirobacteria bacterium]